MIETTINLPHELAQSVKRVARKRGISETELIRTAIRHELLLVNAPDDRKALARRRTRLLETLGKLDNSVFPAAYLNELRGGWRD